MGTAVARVQLRASRWNTLQRLRWMCTATLLLDALLLLLVSGSARQHRATVSSLTEQGMPGVFAARQVEAAVAAMDADAAHELVQLPGKAHAATEAYDTQRTVAVRALIRTAETLQKDQVGAGQVEALEVNLGDYERLLQQARDLHDHGDGVAAVRTFGLAEQLFRNRLMPGAEQLATERAATVDAGYQTQQMHSAEARVTLLVLLLLEAFALVAAQVFLSRTTHRTFNLGLLLATGGLITAGVHFAGALASGQGQLLEADQGLYANLNRLASVRLGIERMRDSQSHGLLGTVGAPDTLNSTALEEAKIASLPAGMDDEQVINALGNGRRVAGFTGLLPDMLAHASAAEERDAIVQILPAWQRFVATDDAILRGRGNRERANAVPLSDAPRATAGDAPFQDLDQRLGAVQTLEETELAGLLGGLDSDDSHLAAEAWLVCLALGGLVVSGFAPRIREYL